VSDPPDLTPEDVKEILRLIDESHFDEFELETARFSIRFNRGAPVPDRSAAAGGPAAADGALVDVTAPMVGTFYRAPSPGAPPFVEVGAEVAEDTAVCIIEVMKLMNSVAAGVRGTVAEVCAGNGEPIQYGDVLFRIRPA
jgi:acetyl-CoA carboxylase biotin carboxyl carrier protein